MLSPESQLEQLKRGAAQIISEEELLAKLRLGRPLNIKLGVDPTAPDIHLGFTVALTKLRQFQDLGHQAILIIGDFTAMIGDPSGRSKTRPPLTHDQVMANASSFKCQAFKILDPQRTRVVFNGEWFEMMSFEQVMRLNARVTLQQMLQREDFRKRYDSGEPVHLHEIQYPIMQGWDSVMIKADVELGGTDQLFNILVGRELQRAEGQAEQVVFLNPLLVGTDGVQKMSKSYGNYVGVSEDPKTQFGKLMSITDDTMAAYYTLLLGEDVPAGHPMDAKKQLARRIVERYHGHAASHEALDDFNTRFSKRDLASADLPILSHLDVPEDNEVEGLPPLDISTVSDQRWTRRSIVTIAVAAYSQCFQVTKSRSDVRRLVEAGSVQVNGAKITNPKEAPNLKTGDIIRLDKTRAVRIA